MQILFLSPSRVIWASESRPEASSEGSASSEFVEIKSNSSPSHFHRLLSATSPPTFSFSDIKRGHISLTLPSNKSRSRW